MNQDKFLSALNQHLNRLSQDERQDILQDFQEHFSNGLADGKTEEEISDSLGSPGQIAKEMLATYHFEKVTEKASTGNIIRAVWAAIGLSFFNLIFVLGPFIGLAGVIFSAWVSGGAFAISPFLALIKYLVIPASFTWFEMFLSIAMSGLGIFLLIGMYYVTKYSFIGFTHYLKFNMKIIQGGVKHE